MATCAVSKDVRVQRSFSTEALRIRAGRSAVRFIRRQADQFRPADKDELVQIIWRLYFRMRRAGVLAAPATTKRMLRRKYGYWKVVLS